MKIFQLTLFLFSFSSFFSFSQMNDTIVFKTGYEKVVEIETFDSEFIRYSYYNKSLDTTKSKKEATKKIRYFVTYDEEGILTYDSRMDYTKEKAEVKVDSLNIAVHDLVVNPFLVPFLSPSIRYTYKFGNYMQWGLHTRLTYISPILGFGNSGIFMAGAGIKFSPYYSRKFSFGFDFVPEVFLDFEGSYAALFPMGIDLDFYFGERFGMAIDAGFGYMTGNTGINFGGRGNIGLLMRLGKRYNVPNMAQNQGI